MGSESSQGSGVPVPALGMIEGVMDMDMGGGVYAGLVDGEPVAGRPLGRGRQRR